MKKILIYTISLFSLYLLSSCIQDDPIQTIKDNTITFVAKPTAYEGNGLPTKAGDTYEAINSLYLLLFTSSDKTVIDMTGKTEHAYVLKDGDTFPEMKAYFLANFSEDFVNNLTSADIDSKILEGLSYESFKPTSNAILGVPMVGKLDALLTSADLGKIKEISLTRLFAKVDVTIEMGANSSDHWFKLESYTFTNVPTEVGLFETPTDLSVTDITVTGNQSTPITLPTLYIPENTNLSNPVSLTLKGVYHRDNSWSAKVEYKVHLGAGAGPSIEKNHAYANAIIIKGVDNATTDSRVTYYGHNLADPTNSGTEEAANCYIISEPGRYIFPAVQGAKSTTPASSTINNVISDGNNTITNIKSVEIDDKEYISFDVTSVTDGNSVLIADDWSWHLWFCEEAPGTQTYPNGSSVTAPVLMDRNLGAGPDSKIDIGGVLSTDFHPVAGLYYRWGDKNPFIGSDYIGVGSAGSWTDGKSTTDPCPPGYKIPSSGVWTNSLSSEVTRYFVDGSFLYSEDFSETTFIRYPFASYRKDDKSLAVFQPVTHPNQDSAPRSRSVSKTIAGQSLSGTLSLMVNYGGTTQYKVTMLHTSDKVIRGEYNEYKVDADNAKYTVKGSVKVTIKILGREKTTSHSIDERNKTAAEIKNYKIANLVTIGTLIPNLDTILGELLTSVKNQNNDNMNLSKLAYGNSENQVPSSHGLQVRCVTE